MAALDDDLEVFDHVAYRFERKDEFLDYLSSLWACRGNDVRIPSAVVPDVQ
jgi:hypothetical protein